jgi:hypothetical protein
MDRVEQTENRSRKNFAAPVCRFASLMANELAELFPVQHDIQPLALLVLRHAQADDHVRDF